MKPEEHARKNIDDQLIKSGWVIQDRNELNLGAAKGVAVREFPLKTGIADYLIFVDREPIGIIEAKKEGDVLLNAEEQSKKYSSGLSESIPHKHDPLPFLYESTGVETFFRDLRDPDSRSRRVFSFHRPETLMEWSEEKQTLRKRIQNLPPLITKPLRECQIEAITNLDKSLKKNFPRALIQMATGSGKTHTATTFIYRLIKYSKARRILFLVDRGNLGNNALDEFQQYQTPDDGRKFTDLYNVQLMKNNTIDTASKVCITTIQRMYSMLKGEKEFEEGNEAESRFDANSNNIAPLDVQYNSTIPIETFDFVVIDECHRSIYNLWRQVLEYFDAFLIGLTATPAKQTFGFFNQNLVMEYSHERAVADGVNVDFEVYRIKTKISQEGSKIDASYNIYKRDKATRRQRWERLDEDIEYTKDDLDKSVVSKNQIRLVIRTFKEKLFSEIFPNNRSDVPKTLIFAKDDSHANDIVQIVREEFGKGNDFCKKVTYKVENEKPENIIKSFRNSYNPRIAVTVDMIATGTDIRPLEVVMFMRDIKSRVYFEQMKGRGTRVISDTDLQAVTKDAKSKTHFVIVDAVGVCDSEKQDSKPLEKKREVGFKKLMDNIALGDRSDENISSLAGRLARLDRQINNDQREEIENLLGKPLSHLNNELLESINADEQEKFAKTEFETDSPNDEQMKKASKKLIDKACQIFDSPKVRDTLDEIKKKNEQIIDEISLDELISSGHDEKAKEQAKQMVGTLKKFLEKNKDEISALQFFYSQPYSKRHLTFEAIEELTKAIEKEPFQLTTDKLWHAYEKLEKNKVQGASKERVLTDLVSLFRFALGQEEVLRPFEESVQERFEKWLKKQKEQGVEFTKEQFHWLVMIKDHIANSIAIKTDDFNGTPFQDRGGIFKAIDLFGEKLEPILEELNNELVA